MMELYKTNNFINNCEELKKLDKALEKELNETRKNSSKINFLKNKIVEIKTTPAIHVSKLTK